MSLVTSTPPTSTRHDHQGRRRLVLVAGANLAMGVPAIVPIWLTWFYLSSWPLAAVGLTDRSPTENDGFLIPSLIILPVILLSAFGWAGAGHLLRRRLGPLPPGPFWLVSTVGVFLPTCALILGPLNV